MARVFCLLNHALTEKQVRELQERFAVQSIEYPPQEIRTLWSNLPVEDNIMLEPLKKIIAWFDKEAVQEHDVLVLQGESGYSFALVAYALKRGLITLHSVTQRIAQETVTGEIVEKRYIFEHICFRKYCYYDAIA